MKRFSIVLVIILTVCFIQTACAQKPFQFGFVKDYDFSGDSVWLANTKKKDQVESKTIAKFSYNGLGTISINGRDVELKLDDGDMPDDNFKVGKGGYQIWKGKKIVVRLDYVFSWLCPEEQENCSAYHNKGVLEVDYNGEQRKVDIVGFGGS